MTEREKMLEKLAKARKNLAFIKGAVDEIMKRKTSNSPNTLKLISSLVESCDVYNQLLSESLGREEKLEKEAAELKEKLALAEQSLAEHDQSFV
ncbi:MAG: hypothetical protein HYT63_01545 [Candidatus Yanofskybacteria bacterium]|nr:hypothetical protein [Candidatus Yanofskybacteria bacterium]